METVSRKTIHRLIGKAAQTIQAMVFARARGQATVAGAEATRAVEHPPAPPPARGESALRRGLVAEGQDRRFIRDPLADPDDPRETSHRRHLNLRPDELEIQYSEGVPPVA